MASQERPGRNFFPSDRPPRQILSLAGRLVDDSGQGRTVGFPKFFSDSSAKAKRIKSNSGPPPYSGYSRSFFHLCGRSPCHADEANPDGRNSGLAHLKFPVARQRIILPERATSAFSIECCRKELAMFPLSSSVRPIKNHGRKGFWQIPFFQPRGRRLMPSARLR